MSCLYGSLTQVGTSSSPVQPPVVGLTNVRPYPLGSYFAAGTTYDLDLWAITQPTSSETSMEWKLGYLGEAGGVGTFGETAAWQSLAITHGSGAGAQSYVVPRMWPSSGAPVLGAVGWSEDLKMQAFSVDGSPPTITPVGSPVALDIHYSFYLDSIFIVLDTDQMLVVLGDSGTLAGYPFAPTFSGTATFVASLASAPGGLPAESIYGIGGGGDTFTDVVLGTTGYACVVRIFDDGTWFQGAWTETLVGSVTPVDGSAHFIITEDHTNPIRQAQYIVGFEDIEPGVSETLAFSCYSSFGPFQAGGTLTFNVGGFGLVRSTEALAGLGFGEVGVSTGEYQTAFAFMSGNSGLFRTYGAFGGRSAWSAGSVDLPCCGPAVTPPTRIFPRDDNQGISTARVRIGRSQPSSRQQSYRQGFRGTYT